jgi:zinc metalloprotease ZmpA
VKRTTALLCTATITVALSSTLLASTLLGTAGAAPPDPDRRAAAVAHAHSTIARQRALVAAGPEEAFVVRDVVLDDDGTEHVRLDRTYRGLPVLGGDVVLHGRPDGSSKGVSKTQRTALDLATTPAVGASRAAATARGAFRGAVDAVDAPVLSVLARAAAPRLVQDTVVHGTTPAGDPSELHVLVDALDGTVLETHDDIETAKPAAPAAGTSVVGTGNTLYLGAVPLASTLSSGTYSLRDGTRGGQTTSDLLGRTSGSGTLLTSSTSTFGTGSTGSRATVAADAAYGAAETWDFYKGTFGRNGIADDGRGAPSRVHYGSSYNNAFWSDSCFCMTFGDGDGVQFNPLVSLDVAGHEMTHGVTSRTAALTYSGESGGLNEATSDIFGTMVEFTAANAQDVPDYTVGEQIVPAGARPLRYLYQPSADGRSPDCYSSTIGSLNVHYSSGVANRFFYLLSEGSGSALDDSAKLCNGAAPAVGITQAKAGKIWYDALTTYMTSSTGYAGARTATLQAAADLDRAEATGTRYADAVAATWTALGV